MSVDIMRKTLADIYGEKWVKTLSDTKVYAIYMRKLERGELLKHQPDEQMTIFDILKENSNEH